MNYGETLMETYVVYELQKINDNSMLYNFSYYGMCYFLFHVFVLDFAT